MSETTHSVDVDVPVRVAYNQWTQFEEFPHFMENVKEVRQLNEKRLFWKAKVGGKEVEWIAEIVRQDPDHMIAWHSTSGAANTGSVRFEPLAESRTRVTLMIDYSPEGFAENAGSALGFVSAQVHGDLQRFKKFIEDRGQETGAWRGSIEGGELHTLED